MSSMFLPGDSLALPASAERFYSCDEGHEEVYGRGHCCWYCDNFSPEWNGYKEITNPNVGILRTDVPTSLLDLDPERACRLAQVCVAEATSEADVNLTLTSVEHHEPTITHEMQEA